MNFIIKKIEFFLEKADNQHLTLTAIFYISLFFSNSNKTLLLLTGIYAVFTYIILKNVNLAAFLAFMITLPFAKGKALQILILPVKDINRFALFDIEYFFPIYITDFFLSILIYLYIRQRITRVVKNEFIKSHQKLIPLSISFIFFLMISILKMLSSSFPEVILLSSIQLLKLFLIFLLSATLINWKKHATTLMSVVSGSLIFQSVWVILQKINHGPLNKDLEVFLPNSRLGIVAAENNEIMRQTGTFFEPSILGTFLLIHVSMIGYVLLKNKLNKTQRNIYTAALILGLTAIVFTGSRAIYLMLILIGIWLIKKTKYQIKPLLNVLTRNKRLLFYSIVISIIIFILTIPTLIQRLRTSSELMASDGGIMYRIELAKYSTRLATKEFLGSGLNLSPYHFATLFDGEKYIFDPAHPHNVFFQVLAENGALGLVFFIIFVYSIFRPILIKKVALDHFSLGALVFLLCAQIYPIFLNHPEILSYFFVYSGIHFQKSLQNDRK